MKAKQTPKGIKEEKEVPKEDELSEANCTDWKSSMTTHSHTDCRTEEGVTVGLIDSLISIARVLKSRDLSSDAVREALMDMRSDTDISQLFNNYWIVSYLQSNTPDLEYCLGYTRVYADDKEDAISKAERRWTIDYPHRMPVVSKMAIKF